MAAKRKTPVPEAEAPRRRGTKRLMLAIPEDVVTRLIDPAQVLGDDADEVESALVNEIDAAVGEIAEALVAAEKSLRPLHALRAAAEGLGFRRGYRTGAFAAGWVVHALTRDLRKGAREAE